MLGIKRATALVLALAMAASLSGCAKWLPWKKAPEATKPPVQAEPAPPPDGGPAAGLFPTQDQQISFAVTDRGKQPVMVTEDLIREGDRVVAVYGGGPYATWLLNAEGVWRKDPKGGALLRYLPRTLREEVWKQASGEAEVWFRLARSAQGCAGLSGSAQPEQCWSLTVLNRGEKTEFLFASGLGPVSANAENWPNPPASFTKKLADVKPGKLETGARAKYLSQAPATSAAPAPVVAVSDADFTKAVTAAQPQ